MSSIISQLPPSSWTDSFENTRMFVLEAPVISFNPKAFFSVCMMNYSGNVFQVVHQQDRPREKQRVTHPR